MVSLDDFHLDFQQYLFADAESRGILTSQAFFENVCESLVATGDLTINYTSAEYIKQGIEVHGYDFDEERKILTLLTHHLFLESNIETLTLNQIKIKFNRLRTYASRAFDGFYDLLEETSDAYSMSYNIHRLYTEKQVDKIRFILLSDGRATKNLLQLPSEVLAGLELEFRVVDIEYLYKLYLSENEETDFEVEVEFPFLEIPTDSDKYQAYLTVIKGETITEIYEQYGQKLFEQNVRTFLQFRGNVNKGIRNTLEYYPEMFFAYNNGITATASEVTIGPNGMITKIKNFQIVNGCQTTSSIYAAKKNGKIDVSKVSAQMKLSVIKDREIYNDYVSKISEYANTQNKVNKSDFFSNSPFHKEMKNYSRRIWAPAVGGSQRRTRWFYERVRGEYLNEQAYLTASEKRKFQLENPKAQLIDKTFLSKSENSWRQQPHIVSRGAQYSFSAFADYITEWLEKDGLAITESYFQDAVSRIILFKFTERLVSKASWYDNGFRAQTVTYTLSLLSYLIEKTGKFLNFGLIWEEQDVPQKLKEIIAIIAERVYKVITNPPPGHANITQWCKRVGCWDSVKQISSHDILFDSSLLIGKEEEKVQRREDRKEKIIDTGIEIQSFVVTQPLSTWVHLYSYFSQSDNRSGVTFTQLDILRKMAQGYLAPPSEKQSKVLYSLFQRAQREGAIS